MAFPIDDDAFCARLLDHDEPADAKAAYGRFTAQRSQVSLVPRYAVGFALAAAALALCLIFTPLGTYARDFLTIFEPKAFVQVDVSSLGTKHGIRLELRSFGTLQEQQMQITKVRDARGVDALAGYHVLEPTYLPANLPQLVGYNVAHGVKDTFTFSAAKARASEARAGNRLPPVPPAIDGTTITMQVGTIVEHHWGKGDASALTIVQMPAPVVRSNGATLAELERYMLTMPDVSPQLAEQIRAIGDPSSTLPVPFRPAKQSAQNVTIQGVRGLAVGDNTGVGTVVMWQTRGMLYFVGGTLRQDEAMKIADGLR